MERYPKLVRDRIPELIRSHGSEPRTRRLSDHEFIDALARKLVEEAEEAAGTRTVEELADVLEVVQALAGELGHSIEDVERSREAKVQERGGFEERWWLEWVSPGEAIPAEPCADAEAAEGSYSSPVKAWTDPESWARRLSPEGCPFCTTEPWSVHVDLQASRVLIPEEAVLPGYVLIVSRRHIIEPYDLPPDESAQFWADAMRAAAAVASVVRPVKVNYEIHGNTIPHLHLHVFPRFRGDPFERSPIDPHAMTPARRSPDEIETLRRAITEGQA